MIDRIAHRGPDAASFSDLWSDTPLQLGHDCCRSSTSRLRRTCRSSEGLHLNYNAELYNYRELRNILREKASSSPHKSDTDGRDFYTTRYTPRAERQHWTQRTVGMSGAGIGMILATLAPDEFRPL